MMNTNRYNYYFYLLLSILVLVLLFVSNTLSISYKEALNVFVNNSVLTYVTNTSLYIFGQNDIALRLPFILFYILSVLMMYKITENYFNKESDRFISICIFMLLPGVLSASLLVNSAIIVTFLTLLYLYYYKITNKHSYVLLCLFVFIDNSFAILFLALFFYSLKDKKSLLPWISLILFSLSMYIYGFSTIGKPRGFFLDTFAIYASIFSPLLFLYFFYSIYRIGFKEKEKSLTWYISTTALILSFLFSFRQRVYIEDFAPYVVISLPFMLKIFFHSYRVRLKEFRKKHNIAVVLVLFMLFINVFFTIVNKPLYLVLPNAKKHFVYKYHFIKELAEELKRNNIDMISSNDEQLLLRLKFYGINEGTKHYISLDEFDSYKLKMTVSYYNKDLYKVYIK
ncbi:glycosyltransferase family 39 protein [Arcobacter peruensis]|uniref:glycosyltransferase family 39 protein n=1 Tax=Arcobacter peruensis TaxID=2320140 RepID=UPI000F07F1C2|nr:glycosyltransferase family 39 protein [Arcobacter peruensis]